MSVTEIASALGEWNLKLREDTPLYLLDALGYFGHVAITSARVDPEEYGDTLLDTARYVGVLRGRSFGESNKAISGCGMAFWLADEDQKGHTIEDTPVVFTNSTFTNAITTLLPPSVQAGTIAALAGLYNGTHQFQSRRQALDYVTGLYNAEWRVRGNGKLDAGLISDLYVTAPKVAILRNRSGLEMDYRALRGRGNLDSDVKDYTTRLLLLGTDPADQSTIVSATANIAGGLNPYVDLFGNPLKLTRLVSETATNTDNAPARAQLQLNRFTSPKDTLKLSTSYYDIRGDVACGDWVWVWDPDAKLEDQNNQIDFEGDILYPMKLRVFQLNWPVVAGMGVAFRTNAGAWFDLTPYVEFETGDTSVTVGGYNRSLTGVGAGPGDNIGSSTTPNTDVPDEPTWNQPFVQSTYQGTDGLTRAQVVLDWNQPLNTNGSVITDGARYEIRWRTGATGVYALTHQDLSLYTHSTLTGTFASPIPYIQGEWQYTTVGWDTTQLLLGDLTPGVPYEFQVRAIDSAVPPNVGDWTSPVITIQTRPDTNAPSAPAAVQTVAGSRTAIQIVHTLGKASGGTYNLELDLNHLKVHVGLSADFTPVNGPLETGGTLIGKVIANQGMLRGQIPIVATFQLDNNPDTPRWVKVVAVDNFGNESTPSAPVQQTATLYDSAFISELTVSKVSAGTILANWIVAAELATATVGARVRMGWYGIEAYNVANIRTFYVNSATGGLEMIGKLIAQDPINSPGDSITIWPSMYNTQSYPAITFESSGSPWTGPAYMNALPSFGGGGTALGFNSGPSAAAAPSNQSTLILGANSYYLQYNSFQPDPQIKRGAQLYGDFDLAQMAAWQEDALKTYIQTRADGLIALRNNVGANGVEFRANGEILIYRDSANQVFLNSSGDVNLNAASGRIVNANRPFGTKAGGFSFESQDGGTYPPGGIRTYATGGTLRFVDNSSGTYISDGAGGTKSFVIPHPTKKDRWLVHGCTESPVAGVEYWGEAEIVGNVCWVPLPDYFEDLTHEADRVVLVTVQLPDEPLEQELDIPEFPEEGPVTLLHRKRMPRQVIREHGLIPTTVGASRPKDGKFRISSNGPDGTRVSWLVKARRKDVPEFEVEPRKSQYKLLGDGPYAYLVRK